MRGQSNLWDTDSQERIQPEETCTVTSCYHILQDRVSKFPDLLNAFDHVIRFSSTPSHSSPLAWSSTRGIQSLLVTIISYDNVNFCVPVHGVWRWLVAFTRGAHMAPPCSSSAWEAGDHKVTETIAVACWLCHLLTFNQTETAWSTGQRAKQALWWLAEGGGDRPRWAGQPFEMMVNLQVPHLFSCVKKFHS